MAAMELSNLRQNPQLVLVDGTDSAASRAEARRSSNGAPMKTRHRAIAARTEGSRAATQPIDGARVDGQALMSMLERTLREIDCGVIVCNSPESALSVLVLGKRPVADDGVARPGIAFPPRPADGRPVRLADADRSLLTLLFTDIVGSTELAERLGDDAWEAVLARHNAIVRAQIARFRGSEVDNTGDGFFATFDAPARAIRCAAAIRSALAPLSLEIRAAVHCGECATVGGRVSGVAVHVTARMVAIAQPGEVLVSGTVRDLVSGSGLAFADRDWHALKGLRGSRQLFALSDPVSD